MLRKLPLVMVIAFMLPLAVSAQKLLHKANKQYRFNHFELAIETYREFLAQEPGHLEARSKLADSYRMNNDLTEASEIYRNLVSIENIDPEVIKQYGHVLMKKGDYENAKYYFNIYSVYNPIVGEHYEMSADFAHHVYEQPHEYDIELMDLNTDHSDFGAAFLGDNLIFSSFRNDIKYESRGKAEVLNGNILYKAKLDKDLKVEEVTCLRNGIAEKKNIGPVTYNSKGQMVVFSRNKIKNGGAHVSGDDSNHSLYVARLQGEGDWKDEHSFRYNEFGTSTAFPSLAFEGNALYFASNRVGGYGGYDIYVSYLKSEGWTYPQNLGPTINTPGNEITPHFTDEVLYFASDYMHGMGGYDIFKSYVNNGMWTQPQNMGNGINSPGDDYYPAVKKGSEMIAFSSNRLGGKGKDDIYLAYPAQKKELADVAPPAAVRLDAIEAYQNPMARTVSNVTQPLTITVLNPPSEAKQSNVAVTQVEESKSVDTRNELVTEVVVTKSQDALVEEVTVKNSTKVEEEPKQVNTKKEEKTEVITTEKPQAYVIPDFKSVSAKAAPLNLDISQAKRVAIGDLLPTQKVYFIQLAALYRSQGNLDKFMHLNSFGNLYKVYKSNSTKIKLGYYYDWSEASAILKKVKSEGYADAFITKDNLDQVSLELMVANDTQSHFDNYTSAPVSATSSKKTYKIRLASYEDPIWFDIAKAKDLGQIEQWTKGGWTIFILSGYSSYDEADLARIKAVNKGFADAEVVLDNNGILERLQKN